VESYSHREGSCPHTKAKAQMLVVNSQEHKQNMGDPMTTRQSTLTLIRSLWRKEIKGKKGIA